MPAMLALALLSGCARRATPADIAEGCYRFSDGSPFFRVAGRKAIFVGKSGLKSFKFGAWKPGGREVEVTPAFILHDGTLSAPAGPPRMAEAVTTISTGVVRYSRASGSIVMAIPVEAYGWREVHLGKPCSGKQADGAPTV